MSKLNIRCGGKSTSAVEHSPGKGRGVSGRSYDIAAVVGVFLNLFYKIYEGPSFSKKTLRQVQNSSPPRCGICDL